MVDENLKKTFNLIPFSLSVQSINFSVKFQNSFSSEKFGECIGKKCHLAFFGKEEICEFCPLSELEKQNSVKKEVTVNGEQKIISLSKISDAQFNEVIIDVELKEIYDELERFKKVVSSVRHDINNPLTGIIGQAQLILMTQKNLSENVVKKIQQIEEMGFKIKEINNRLIELKK